MRAADTEQELVVRTVEPEVLPTCAEPGIGFVPFSPLGKGCDAVDGFA